MRNPKQGREQGKKGFKKRLSARHRTNSCIIPRLNLERTRSLDTGSISPKNEPPAPWVVGEPPPTPRTELKTFNDRRSLLKIGFTIQLDAGHSVRGCRISYADRPRSEIYNRRKGKPESIVAYVSTFDLQTALGDRDLSTGAVEEGKGVLEGIIEEIPTVRFDTIMLPDSLGAGIKPGTILMPLDEVYRVFLAESSIHRRKYLSSVCACLGMHLEADIVGLHVLKMYAKVSEDFYQVGTLSIANPGCIFPERRCAYWRTRTDFEQAVNRITGRSEKALRDIQRAASSLRKESVERRKLEEQIVDTNQGALDVASAFERYCEGLMVRQAKAMARYYTMEDDLNRIRRKCKNAKLECQTLQHQYEHAMHVLERHTAEHRSCTNRAGDCMMSSYRRRRGQ